MVHKKRASKRITLKRKYFVEKKVREHHRKLRREAKKNPNKRKGLKKDPGIPNLYPFKQQFVDKMERMKEKQDKDVQRQKEERAKEHERRRQMSIQEMRESARRREQHFTERQVQKEELESQGITDVKDSSRRAYYREFKKVVTAADVILEVLDARDPIGCRCPEIEQSILAQDPNKKIILILNKIDLVPGENVEKWLKYLRNEFPTLAFKCSTQKQKRNIGRTDVNVMNNLSHTELMQSSGCLGAETLIQLLKNYCRSLNMKTSVTVGIIGYPNVGKSSLINSLKRSRAVGVGATPGFTKTMQEIHIDKHVKLLDCPGIVFSSHSTESDLILRNCMKVEQLEDPLAPVEAILKRCKKEKLLEIYCIPNYEDSKEFLSHIARRTGKLIRGGIPNYDKAAKIVLADWNAGKIPFYSMPPALTGVHVSASIVSNWAQEMNLADVMEQERTTVISSLKPSSESDYIVFDSTTYGAVDKGFVGDEMADAGECDDGGEGEYMGDEYEDGEEDDENGMEDDYASGDEDGAPLDPSSLAHQKHKMRDEEDNLNVQVNRKLQKLLKKKKKGKELNERIRLPKIPAAYEKSQEDEEDSAFSFARDFVADNDMEGSDDEEEEEEDGGEGEEEEEEEEEEDEEDGEKEKGRKKQDVDLFDVDDI